MKILLVHNSYRNYGGEDAYVNAQHTLLKEHGHSVIMYQRSNREINEFSGKDWLQLLISSQNSRKTYTDIQELIRTHQPDVAHIHNTYPLISPSVYQACLDAGVAIVQTAHNYRFFCPNGLFFDGTQVCMSCSRGHVFHAVRKRCLHNSLFHSVLYAYISAAMRRQAVIKKIAKMIVLTEFSRQKFLETGLLTPDRLVIVPNYQIEQMPDVHPGTVEQPYILYMGRLSKEKGVDVVIRAMIRLPDLQLYIMGDGPIRRELEQLAESSRIRNVRFLGHIDGVQKWQVLAEASAHIVPSVWYEGFGLTILEGMQAGVPVIASAIGGIEFVISNYENGLLFIPGDENDLCRKVKELVTTPDLREKIIRNGQAAMRGKYSAQNHYQQLMDVYREVVG